MSGLDRMFAKIVLASRPADTTALPLITMHLHYPDIIHGEVMTHRVFSRNARSMRAVPIKTMVEEVRNDPFVPWHWGKNQRGMQALEECNTRIPTDFIPMELECNDLDREEAWRHAARTAAGFAEAFGEAGYHKQVANRLIAPFTWKHTLITSTSWANFLHLRDHDDAEPHFHDLAIMVREALAGAQYQTLLHGDWHLPYVTRQEKKFHSLDVLQKLSVARSARISYAPFDGDASIERELERYDLLVGSSPLHASPTEHQATPDRGSKLYLGNGKMIFENPDLGGNFGPGWIQFRKTLAGEYVKDAA
ncbi:Thymidylate synthase complementing protein [Rhizobium sp. AN5]|uniref:FAD-dependent thymidylate synthase n=1 Tax=Rhizobium sp. AN5 TaxID=1855304 RepID=UPI000BC6B8C8|nr:FAD-dependent thymidylate synthase [Rhizobium sp. AN5]SOC90091.1 Thymidylate synthase complementing protein [Rhizobium sp. AN5]